MKTLIINADDFGAAEGTVEAISALYSKGIVTSTTALVNLPDWPKGADFLRKNPELGAGVHLVMNDGRPVLPRRQVPSLVKSDGHFYDGTPLLLRYGRLSLKQLEAEWRAQIEKFIQDTEPPAGPPRPALPLPLCLPGLVPGQPETGTRVRRSARSPAIR